MAHTTSIRACSLDEAVSALKVGSAIHHILRLEHGLLVRILALSVEARQTFCFISDSTARSPAAVLDFATHVSVDNLALDDLDLCSRV